MWPSSGRPSPWAGASTATIEKDVKMAGNGYYDEIMARLEETDMGHKELKQYLEDEKISVKELGGWNAPSATTKTEHAPHVEHEAILDGSRGPAPGP
jgi:hypothetical protein